MQRRTARRIGVYLFIMVIMFVIGIVSVRADSLPGLVDSARLLEGGAIEVLGRSGSVLFLAELNNERMLAARKSGHYVGLTERWRLMKGVDVDWSYMGEVSCFFEGMDPTAGYILNVFRSSPAHWSVLMDLRYTHICTSVTRAGDDTAVTIILLEQP